LEDCTYLMYELIFFLKGRVDSDILRLLYVDYNSTFFLAEAGRI